MLSFHLVSYVAIKFCLWNRLFSGKEKKIETVYGINRNRQHLKYSFQVFSEKYRVSLKYSRVVLVAYPNRRGIASYILFPAVRPHARWRSFSRENLN